MAEGLIGKSGFIQRTPWRLNVWHRKRETKMKMVSAESRLLAGVQAAVVQHDATTFGFLGFPSFGPADFVRLAERTGAPLAFISFAHVSLSVSSQ